MDVVYSERAFEPREHRVLLVQPEVNERNPVRRDVTLTGDRFERAQDSARVLLAAGHPQEIPAKRYRLAVAAEPMRKLERVERCGDLAHLPQRLR